MNSIILSLKNGYPKSKQIKVYIEENFNILVQPNMLLEIEMVRVPSKVKSIYMEMRELSPPEELFNMLSIDDKGMSFWVYSTHLNDGIFYIPMSNILSITNISKDFSTSTED